ncbi:signal-regulatory protein beta-2-like [Parambassis ranga]|uniref:Signal-regulatory protein beta-2-like n=1 Tax=Parambassis ranga TaxID=210632 RepID=A0A6P7J7Q8_9TELE|nr:signal-regulatory protein beta-2-like [Parambassis ranga]
MPKVSGVSLSSLHSVSVCFVSLRVHVILSTPCQPSRTLTSRHDGLHFEAKTVDVGQSVTLTCSRKTSLIQESLYWIRLISGSWPEVLGGTFTFNYDDVNKTPHVTTTQGPGTFILKIKKAELSDTGVYYCMKVNSVQLNMEFVTGSFLRVKGPEPDITEVIQVPPSDPVRPGDSVTLQCSVLFDSQSKTCPADHRVFWFRAGSGESRPSLLYAHGNSGDKCESRPAARSTHRCFYSFSKNVSSSDAGTYYCAVAACGGITFGTGTRLDIEELSMWDLQKANTALFVLCAALSLIVVTFLICTIKKKTCDCCNAATDLQKGGLNLKQKDEDMWIYSVVHDKS